MKYNQFSLGKIEAVFNKLGGVYGVNRFLSGQTEIKAIPKDFPVWKKAKVGMFTSIQDVWKAFERRGVEFKESIAHGSKNHAIRHHSVVMLNSPSFVLTNLQEDIELVLVTLKDLGFKESDSVPRKEVIKWASQIGLEMCPHDVVIDLLLNHEIDDERKDLQIVTKPIPSENGLRSFRIREDGGAKAKLLDWDIFDANGHFFDFEKFVFRLVRPAN